LTLSSSNANGTNNTITYNGVAATLTLTSTMTQNLDVTGSPIFANITDNGLTASAGLVSQSAGKLLQSTTISNSNGCNTTFAGSNLTCSMSQDLSSGGSSSFVTTHLSNIQTYGGSGKSFALTDADTEIRCTSSLGAINMSIPPNSVTAFPIGTRILTLQASTRTVSVTASAGVTLNVPSGYSTSTGQQYSWILITKVGTDTWDLTSDNSGSGASPVYSDLTLTSSKSAILGTDSSGLVHSATIVNTNGCNFSYTAVSQDINCAMTQNLDTNGSPSFMAMAL